MPSSASTPRLRLTQLLYLLLVLASAVIGPSNAMPGNSMGSTVLLALAMLLVAFACLGRIFCSVFIAGRKDAQLVTQGPYAMLRHPLYVLSFIGGLGLALASGSVTLIVLTALALATLLSSAARAEDGFLRHTFPQSWPGYAQSTPAFWPRLSSWTKPGALEVHVGVLWKAFVDAGAFFLLFSLVLLARAVRESGSLPIHWTLP